MPQSLQQLASSPELTQRKTPILRVRDERASTAFLDDQGNAVLTSGEIDRLNSDTMGMGEGLNILGRFGISPDKLPGLLGKARQSRPPEPQFNANGMATYMEMLPEELASLFEESKAKKDPEIFLSKVPDLAQLAELLNVDSVEAAYQEASTLDDMLSSVTALSDAMGQKPSEKSERLGNMQNQPQSPQELIQQGLLGLLTGVIPPQLQSFTQAAQQAAQLLKAGEATSKFLQGIGAGIPGGPTFLKQQQEAAHAAIFQGGPKPQVHCGENAKDPAIRLSDLLEVIAFINAMNRYLISHIHAENGPPVPSSSNPLPPNGFVPSRPLGSQIFKMAGDFEGGPPIPPAPGI